MSIGSILAASPETLRTAGGKLGNVAVGLSSRASEISAAADVAVANWSGVAASLCANHCDRLVESARTGATAVLRAGGALDRLATELEYAQELARRAQSYAASIAGVRAQIASMEPSPMIRVLSEEAAAAAWQASAAEAEAESIARAAAAHATGVLSEVAGMAPSQRDPAWGGVLNLSARELNAFFSLDLAGLPDRMQSLAGRELATLVEKATSSDDFTADEIDELFEALDANAYDGDFTAGFFNELGAAGTADITAKLTGRFGYFTDEVEPFMQPLSVALGTASKQGLDPGFAQGLLDRFLSEHTGLSAHVASLVEYGTYESGFIVALAERAAVWPLALAGGLPIHTFTDRPVDIAGVILEAVSRTPKAARTLLLKDFPVDPSVPEVLAGKSYMKVLLDAPYADQAAGLNALITAATNETVPPGAAYEVMLKLIQEAPDVGVGNMFTSTHQLIAQIASERWDDFARSAWAAQSGKGWALSEDFDGEVTDNGIRLSMHDSLAFMEFIVADPEARKVMEDSMTEHVDELIRHSLLDLPEGAKRDHTLERAGAAMELFSLGDTHFRRDDAEQTDKQMAQYQTLLSLASGEVLLKVTPGGKVVDLVTGPIVDAAIDKAFKENHELQAMSATEQQELRYFAELDLRILGQAGKAGILTPEQVEFEMERLAGKGGVSRHAINEKLDPLKHRAYEAMLELRREWLDPED